MLPDIKDFVKWQRVPSGEQRNKEMFRFFTERAQDDGAGNQRGTKPGHTYVGTEHLLLGLASEGAGVAATVLVSFDFDLDKAR